VKLFDHVGEDELSAHVRGKPGARLLWCLQCWLI
jgi:hypothetical protein